jgi:hypothetical protein
MVLLMLVDYARPRMVDRQMIWRWQALGRVGVMLQAHPVSEAASANENKKQCAASSEYDEAVIGSAGAGSAMKLGMVGARELWLAGRLGCRATVFCNRW